MRSGITVAGNILLDCIKSIPSYPKPGMLTTIKSINRAVGGSVPNVLLDLAKMGNDIPLSAVGLTGNDEPADFITSALSRAGVDTSFVQRTDESSTSFTDVMSAEDTGERSFFQYRGANALFSPAHIPLDKLNSRILHIAYLLLLDIFDSEDSEYGTVMARFLHDAQQTGIKTSIDVVSDTTGLFAKVVRPALRYSDYVIMNEIEACNVFGLPSRDEDGNLLVDNVKEALFAFKREGVRERAVVHCPECGFCVDENNVFTAVPSFRLPEGYIKGSVGAGDAFCAACLRSVYFGRPAEEMLSFAAAAAAANLSAADSVSGMKSEEELYTMMKTLPVRK